MQTARPRFVLLLVALSVPAPAAAQIDLPVAAERFVGCYAVHLDAWDPPLRRNAAYHTPPDTVVLDTLVIEYRRGRHGLLLAPHVDALTRYRLEPAYWSPIGADSVRLVWSDGLHGVWMRLGAVEDGLDGQAEIITDQRPAERRPDGSVRALPLPVARVRLVRVACE